MIFLKASSDQDFALSYIDLLQSRDGITGAYIRVYQNLKAVLNNFNEEY